MTHVVISVPHVDSYYHQWVLLPGFHGQPITEKRSANGRRHRHAWRDWLVVMCNNPNCPARALISAEFIQDAVQEVLPVPAPVAREKADD